MDNPLAELAGDGHAAAERLAASPAVAGAQVAGWLDGRTSHAVAGLADTESGHRLGEHTRFRPGSITKLLTATMVMQCVEEGLVELAAPVTRYVPHLRLIDDASGVLVGHLLSHSSGIDAGDLFVDTGAGDDCRAGYVELLEGSGLLFPPGATFSYNNAGFVLAGHVVEQVRGQSFEDVARRLVFEPLGMEHTEFLTGAEQDAKAASESFARGHLAGPGTLTPVPEGELSDDPMCTRALAPAGSTLSTTALDLLRFATWHLDERWSTMRELHAIAPGGVTKMVGVGYAWQIWTGVSGLAPRIGGANPGQSGIVALDPVAGAALVALTNSDQGVNAVNLVLNGPGPAAVPDDEPFAGPAERYAGCYRALGMAFVIAAADGALDIRIAQIDEARVGATRVASLGVTVPGGGLTDQAFPLTPIDRTTFASPFGPIAFVDLDGDGRPDLLRFRMRALRRAD